MVGRFGRAVPSRKTTVRTGVIFVILVIIMTALNLGPMLTTGFAFSAGAELIVVNMVLSAIITVGFLGIAFGQRSAFLAIAVGAVGVVVLVLNNNPALGTLGSYVFLALGAIVGWIGWRSTTPVAAGENSEAEPDVSATEI